MYIYNFSFPDYPVPGTTTVYDTTETIDIENVPLNGGVLIKVLLLSIDPYLRGRLPFPLGQPLMGGGIGVVLRSEVAGVEAGAHVRGMVAHQEYMIAPNLAMLEIIQRDPKLNWSVYVGAAGMPGETAFVGWREYSGAKKVVMVIQIAKQDGLKVIASAGSEEKVKFMKEIGADVAFNYKTTDVREVLAKEGPIDIFWDNVGGDTLDAAREHAALHSRIIECGQISGYNSRPLPMKNPGLIFAKCMHFHGFLRPYLRPKHIAAFNVEFVPKIVSGELDKVGDAILAVQKGTNAGKAIVILVDRY
ncbi:hypothetical protein K438DRAFT_1874671 [Mycena galopus ATCC 62051]|nr:hypothetical protein K438DRAFT_1874671 [Mycena galopus ATCC 62051]